MITGECFPLQSLCCLTFKLETARFSSADVELLVPWLANIMRVIAKLCSLFLCSCLSGNNRYRFFVEDDVP
jgi:hypothetical protein